MNTELTADTTEIPLVVDNTPLLTFDEIIPKITELKSLVDKYKLLKSNLDQLVGEIFIKQSELNPNKVDPFTSPIVVGTHSYINELMGVGELNSTSLKQPKVCDPNKQIEKCQQTQLSRDIVNNLPDRFTVNEIKESSEKFGRHDGHYMKTRLESENLIKCIGRMSSGRKVYTKVRL